MFYQMVLYPQTVLKDQEEAEEFKNFVQSIKPSDFAKMMKDSDHHESDQ